MNIKQFLRPDWRKTVLFLLLVALSFVLGIGKKIDSPVPCGVLYELNPVFFPLQKILGNYICSEKDIYDFNVWKNLFFECTKLGECRLNITNIVLYTITLFYLYFLPCLIIFSYDRFKSMKTKK